MRAGDEAYDGDQRIEGKQSNINRYPHVPERLGNIHDEIIRVPGGTTNLKKHSATLSKTTCMTLITASTTKQITPMIAQIMNRPLPHLGAIDRADKDQLSHAARFIGLRNLSRRTGRQPRRMRRSRGRIRSGGAACG